VVAPHAQRTAVAGLVSHLHRDHADADALAGALADDAWVHEPAWPAGSDVENLGLAQANAELERATPSRRAAEVWERVEVGPFVLTSLPAVDGLGDPQVSWLVEADGQRILHLGDTIFHGYWWRMARRHGPFDVVFAPINGAVVDFPHLQPPSPLAATMEPEQAAVAAELLGARAVVRCTTTASRSHRCIGRSPRPPTISLPRPRSAPTTSACSNPGRASRWPRRL
jgi:L-ascorbate metabolism protein UlaG (beta-lactamase superfamily)